MKLTWYGEIEKTAMQRKRTERLGIILILIGIILFPSSIAIDILYNPAFAIVISLAVLSLILIFFSILLLTVKIDFIGITISVTSNGIEYLIKKGVVKKNIEELLTSNHIDFRKNDESLHGQSFTLPENLNVFIGHRSIPIGTKKLNLVIIQIRGINMNNVLIAKNIQMIIDKLEIPGEYLSDEEY